MELEDFQDRFIDELSGGQRQRAMIAMVIAQDTEFVLLDEPTNNLDIYHATNMMKIVRRLCDELGKTVILVLHEINYAAFYSDYICAFKDGKIAKFGTVEEVMTKENLSQIYQVDFEILNIAGETIVYLLLSVKKPYFQYFLEKEQTKMNMKKILSFVLASVMALSLISCSAQNGGDSSENTVSLGGDVASQPESETQNIETREAVTITSLNASKEAAELEVPYDPQRIAILDYGLSGYSGCPGVWVTGWWAPPPPAWTISRPTSTMTLPTSAPSRRLIWRPLWPASRTSSLSVAA